VEAALAARGDIHLAQSALEHTALLAC
jgi:hypothetical protein